MDIFTWVIAGLAIIGVVLNVKKRIEGFYLWSVTNGAWVFVDFKSALYAQAFLFTVYTGLSIWGIFEWTGVKNNLNNQGRRIREKMSEQLKINVIAKGPSSRKSPSIYISIGEYFREEFKSFHPSPFYKKVKVTFESCKYCGNNHRIPYDIAIHCKDIEDLARLCHPPMCPYRQE